MSVPERPSLALSENILTLLAMSDDHGKLIASIIDPNLFEGELRNVADRCISYWRAHNTAPKVHMGDLFADILEDPNNRRAPTYRRLITSMFQLSDQGVNAKYVLDQLQTFMRMQKLKDAVLRAAEVLNRPMETSITQVEDILHDILRVRTFQFDAGLRLSDYEKLLKYLQHQYAEFDTGIKAFDEGGIMPSRGTLFILLGASGKGKTWGLIQLAKRALLRGKKVLFITPELSEEEVMLRCYQTIYSVARRKTNEENNVQITTLELDGGDHHLVGFGSETVPVAFHFQTGRGQVGPAERVIAEELKFHTRAYYARLKNMLIKRVIPRQFSMNALRGYLDSLENVEGFIPDMVIFDSAYLSKYEGKDYRLGLGRNYEEFRAIGIERNMCMVASHQVSREGSKASRTSYFHVGEDWSIVQTADIICTYSATEIEQELGLGRLYADKVRHEKGNVALLLTQNYTIGQFAIDSHRLDDSYFRLREEIEQSRGTSSDGDDDNPEES